MIVKSFLPILFIVATLSLSAQEYIGAGSDIGVRVTTSSDHQPDRWEQTASGDKTISGDGLTFHQMNASRFLSQATIGPSEADIHSIQNSDFEAWMDVQFASANESILDETYAIKTESDEWFLMNGGDSLEIGFRPSWREFNYAWWSENMSTQNKLRHRVAFALSEIFVISIRSDLSGYGDGLASYYDVLLQNAFGNYRDLLFDVSLHPAMGFYLSHLNNPKAIPEENIHPDENYAREVMQLFSIGLYELNQDGSRKKDGQGNDIPTYGQDEIKEFAKIFTGLGLEEVVMENEWVDEAYFGLGIYLGDMVDPMIMYDDWHSEGEKHLLNGTIVPAGQTGMEDINAGIDNLFNHPNVAPFIGKHLIQKLIKSNPTPGYVERVSNAFNDNGQGVRGDMQAVLKAIFLDPEARDCDWLEEETASKLREPLIRYTHFANAMEKEHFYGRLWNVGWGFLQATNQMALASPSVFNFYLPDFQPNGEISDNDLYAPEFQIHNSKTAIRYMNEVNRWAGYGVLFYTWETNDPDTYINIDELKKLAYDPEVLINKLDMLFTNGSLSDRTRGIITTALNRLVQNEWREDRVRMALYLIMVSPDYAIIK